MRRIVLASASPRRRRLLAGAGIAFEVRVSGVDETHDPSGQPEAIAEELARRKATAVAMESNFEEALFLGADTVVALQQGDGWNLLGKPAHANEARDMLARLSGTRHAVVTGVCVVRGVDGEVFLDSERTWVVMREIKAEEIDAYVESGEWEDKAGGYAIQESADAFVEALEGGGFDNVVGLPLKLTKELLSAAGG